MRAGNEATRKHRADAAWYSHQQREGLMHIFLIRASEAGRVEVFANSYDEAVRIYMIYWITHHDTELPDLDVRMRNSGWPGLDTKLLQEALSRGVTGIGCFDPTAGWDILAPDYVQEAVVS